MPDRPAFVALLPLTYHSSVIWVSQDQNDSKPLPGKVARESRFSVAP